MKTINFERKRKTLENERHSMIVDKVNSTKMISLLTVTDSDHARKVFGGNLKVIYAKSLIRVCNGDKNRRTDGLIIMPSLRLPQNPRDRLCQAPYVETLEKCFALAQG